MKGFPDNESRHIGQYKGNFYIMDVILIANLPPTKAPLTRMRFQVVLFSYRCVFKSIHFGLRFYNRLSSFPCEEKVKTQRYRNWA